MKNNLTEHVLNIGKEFEEAFADYGGEYSDTTDAPTKFLKSHLLLSQLKTIELLKENLEGMKKEIPFEMKSMADIVAHPKEAECYDHDVGFNSALSQAITLLDTIIQDVKLQMK